MPGPYLIHKVEFVRTNAQQLTNLPSYNPTSVARVMDRAGLRMGVSAKSTGCRWRKKPGLAFRRNLSYLFIML